VEPLSVELGRELRRAAVDWSRSRPRSLQAAIGPSEIGHPCDRFLAYKALQLPDSTDEPFDSLPSTVGTAMHDYVMADALSRPGVGVRGTEHLPSPLEIADMVAYLKETGGRWIVEQRVEVAPGLTGSSDAYDTWTNTVVDHKFLGWDSYKNTRRHGPKQQYRTQFHSYGFGFARLGFDVQHVAVGAWLRPGLTTDLVVITEPYDEQVVEEGLQRWYQIAEGAPGLAKQPVLFNYLPMADGPCSFCPFRNAALAATDPGAACAGHPTQKSSGARRPQLTDLIA